MTGINVRHGIGDLANDLAGIAPKAVKGIAGTLREGARVGAQLARESARRTAGKHGKHYPRSITADHALKGGFGLWAIEYGPDPSRPQGGMSFEFGSRNQKPHFDLARSADMVAPAVARDIGEKAEDWFREAGFRG